MAPLPAPRLLPFAERTSLSRRRRRRPGPHSRGLGSGRNESIGRGSSEVILVAWLPLLPEPTGVERGRLQQADGPTDWGTLWGEQGGTGLGGRPLQMKRDSGSPGRRAPADFYLLPRAEWSAENEVRSPSPESCPTSPRGNSAPLLGQGAASVGLGSQDEGLPTPRGPAHRALSFPPIPDSALQWGIRRAGRVLGSRVEWGASRSGGAQAHRFPVPPAPPALRGAERSPLSAGKYIFGGRVKARLSFEL